MLTISVCIGSACHLKGSFDVISGFQRLLEAHGLEKNVEIKAVFCMGNCAGPVSVRVDGEKVQSVRPAEVDRFFRLSVLPKLEIKN